MSWLKRQQPLSLIQGSDLPYVILEDGVHLCHSNFYEEENPRVSGEYLIQFSVPRQDMIRQSTYLFRFRQFPVIVPFSSISRLDNSIIEGKILRHASSSDVEGKKISLISMKHLSELFEEYTSQIDGYDHNFILYDGEDISPEARLLESDEQFRVLYHKEWGRTCVAIAHETCCSQTRKYCWTRSVPEMDVVCFGLENADNKESIQNCLDDIGISASVIWSD